MALRLLCSTTAYLAASEGHVRVRREILSASIGWGYEARSMAEREGLRDEGDLATIATASALADVGQWRKARLLAEDVMQGRTGDFVALQARSVVVQCLAVRDPKAALMCAEGLIENLREEWTPLEDKCHGRLARQRHLVGHTLALSLWAVGRAYSALQAFDVAHYNLEDARVIAVGLCMTRLVVRILDSQVRVFDAQGKLAEALNMVEQMTSMAASVQDQSGEYEAMLLKARVLATMQDYEKAIEVWKLVTPLAVRYEDRDVLCAATESVVYAMKLGGNYSGALREASTLFRVSGTDRPAEQRSALHSMAECHYELGNYKECLEAIAACVDIDGGDSANDNDDLLALQAKALSMTSNGEAALECMRQWNDNARSSGSLLNAAKSHAALGDALGVTSPVEARSHYFAVLDSCLRMREAGEAFPEGALELVLHSVQWLVHEFFTVSRPMLVSNDDGKTYEEMLSKDLKVAMELVELAFQYVHPITLDVGVDGSPRSALTTLLQRDITVVTYFAAGESSGSLATHYGVFARFKGTTDVRHAQVRVSSEVSNFHRVPATDNRRAGADDLDDTFALHRALYEALWSPVEGMRTADVQHQHSEIETIILIPDPSLLHVPFAALMSGHRRVVGQKYNCVVVPCARHCIASEAFQKNVCRNHQEQDISSAIVAIVAESNMKMDKTVKLDASRSPVLPLHSRVRCSRKDVIDLLKRPSPVCSALLLQPIGIDGLMASDGVLHILPIVSTISQHHIIVVTSDRSIAPSPEAPGLPTRLLTLAKCAVVLRVDVTTGTLPNSEQLQLVRQFIDRCSPMQEAFGIGRYGTILADIQRESIQQRIPMRVWSTLSVIGAA